MSGLFFKAVSIAACNVICCCAVAAKLPAMNINSMPILGLNHPLKNFVFSNVMYNTGNTNNVSSVATSSPPITTVASGRCTSAPAPLLSAIGRKPSEATAAVMSTGRSLVLVPPRTTCFKFAIPSLRKRLNSEINTIPFNTATPNSAMNPTPALMLKGIPRIVKAIIPPMAESGMAE